VLKPKAANTLFLSMKSEDLPGFSGVSANYDSHYPEIKDNEPDSLFQYTFPPEFCGFRRHWWI
jgi:hypothetical protein